MSQTSQVKSANQSVESVARITHSEETENHTNDGLLDEPQSLLNQLCEQHLVDYLDSRAVSLVKIAYEIAIKAYEGHYRNNSEPFILQPLYAAIILAELRLDENSICAVLLYDVYAKSEVNKELIEAKINQDVASLVEGVAKIKRIAFTSPEQAEAENFRKMLMAMSKDIRVIIIKLSQRLHTMRSIEGLEEDKQRRVAIQTLEILAPLANRLGLHHWSTELQELCFKQIYPKRYKALVDVIKERDGNRKAKVLKMREDIQKSINDASILSQVTGRKKSPYSIYKKMLHKKRTFEQLNDLYAFRVIVENVDDCYRVLGVIHNHYKPIPGSFVDYIAIPKGNGYQSLHTIVLGPFGDNIEVQIRTQGMHEVAEAGVAAHWLYKSDVSSQSSEATNLSRQWLIDLLDPDQHSSNPSEFLEHLKTDLYIDEVYVFTPNGDIKKLPRGATALDFAYAVHTGVGSKSKSAIINSQPGMLSTELKNGDHVRIITDDDVSPKITWLKFAVTGRARTQIRSYLNSQSDESAKKIGEKLFLQELFGRGFQREDITQSKQKELLKTLNIHEWSDLLIEIGKGNRIASLVIRQMFPAEEGQKSNVKHAPVVEIEGTEGMVLNLSRCCLPVPGDDIVGAVTGGSGLVVHRLLCSNFANMQLEADQVVPLKWGKEADKVFPARLRVYVRSQRSMFAKIAMIIAEQGCNILDVETAESTEEYQPIDIVLEVKNRIHLAQVIRKLRIDEDVQRVFRQQG